MMQTIHDSSGRVVAWLDDDRVLTLEGESLLWVEDLAVLLQDEDGDEEDDEKSPADVVATCPVYDYDGYQVGTFEHGFFRDESGDAVAYIEGASFGPVAPVTAVGPVPPVPAVEPVRPVASVPYVAPVATVAWSELSWEEYSSPEQE